MKGQILLSFDVEEFDIPLEYGYHISMDEQIQIGKKGLDALTPILAAEDISVTLFITANFAKYFPPDVHALAQRHEIASHTYFHSTFENGDLLKSRRVLEVLTGQTVTGLRMPRMRQPDMAEVIKAGFLYDASLNPTWIPGRYNHFKMPRLPHKEKGIYRLPASVSPDFRLPLFWLAFKNYPYAFFKKLCLDCLKADGYLCLYFHPWEFVDITNYNLPRYVRRLCGLPLLHRLQHLIEDLKKEGDFIAMKSFVQMNTG